MARRTLAEFEAVKARLSRGCGVSEIATELRIPRGTVQRWSARTEPPFPAVQQADAERWSILDVRSYCYLLGAYLGDWTVSHPGAKGWTLRIINDQRYPEVSREILKAMAVVFPRSTPKQWPASHAKADILHVAHPAIPRAFPQNGPGRKHTRPIVLADWQLALSREHPGALVRGLIHPDGCRSINHVKTTLPSGRVAEYRYVRYFFTNHSADIRGIFADHCALLGVRVTQSNHRNLSVSHRDSVAVLEEVVGVKH